MDILKTISPNIYLIVSLVLITIAIVILFFGKIIFSVISLLMGIISLIAWTFLGLFEDG
tara:strand:+ start:519 stop:695 length:177 start_codon:yes stop_codon:yes gene_type:complete